MSLFIKKHFKKTLFLAFILLTACGTDYEEMQTHFFAKRYLETIECAVKGAKDPRYDEQIRLFCKESGDKVLERALEKIAAQCLDSTTPLGLEQLERFQTALKEGMALNLPLPTAPAIYEKSEILHDLALHDFLITQKSLGTEALANQQTKKAVGYFQNVLRHNPQDEEAQSFLVEAQKKAIKHLVITHFYTDSQTVVDSLQTELSVLTKTKRDGLKIKTVTRINGMNINDMLYEELLRQLDKKKDAFLIIHSENEETPSDAILIQGRLESTVADTEKTPIRSLQAARLSCLYEENGVQRWRSEACEFPIYTLKYQVSLKAIIEIPENTEWTVEGEHLEIRQYRTEELYWIKPYDVIKVEFPAEYHALNNAIIPVDRDYVCRAAIQDLAKNIAEKIIEEFK